MCKSLNRAATHTEVQEFGNVHSLLGTRQHAHSYQRELRSKRSTLS